MAEVDRQFIKVSEQISELKAEIGRLKNEIALLREAVQRQSLKEIPFKGTIS
jgi:archaellum component FlaC